MNTPASRSPRRLPVVTLALLGSVLGATSCGDDTGSGSQDTLESWSLSEEPSVVIGGADEREDYLLHQVAGAARLADGRIVIANGGSLELKYYDPEGKHLFDAGGAGRGSRRVATAPQPFHPSSRRLDPRGFLPVGIHSIRARRRVRELGSV